MKRSGKNDPYVEKKISRNRLKEDRVKDDRDDR